MLLLVAGLLFAWPMAHEGNDTAAQAQSRVRITGNGVRLRYGPGLNYGIYTQVNRGTTLSWVGTSGNWYAVNYGGYTLYVSADYAVPTSSGSTSSSSATYVVVNASNLRLRTGPSTSYPYLIWTATGKTVYLNHGDVLRYQGVTTNGFCKVIFDGRTAWVARRYVRLK